MIFTVDQVMRIGLDWAGFDACRRERVIRATNIKRFQSHFGCSPLVCAVIWEDLLTTEIQEARINPATTLDKMFLALYLLNVYTTEEKLAGCSKLCETTARKWAWFIASRIQALKAKKIVWPEHWGAVNNVHVADITVPNFLYSVDGIHCRTNEVMHPTLAKDKQLYSHKFNQAGFAYELAISLSDNSLVWMNGPFVASKHDVSIFRDDGGLKEKTPKGKKGIADQGYRGEKEILCTPNSRDTPALREYKTRARARHETFNGRLKNFASLDNQFRHGMAKHKICFEAICVIVQYQLENGAPLFDI